MAYISPRDQADWYWMMDKVRGIKNPDDREVYLEGIELFSGRYLPPEEEARPETVPFDSLRKSLISITDTRRSL